MSRRLAPDEQALWALVAATVKPLHPHQPVETPPGPAPVLPPKVDRHRVGAVKARAAPSPLPSAARPPSETLDSSWDNRITSGKLTPDIVIDLHGLRREQARHLLYSRVADAEARGLRVILVITGKGHNPGPSPADLMEGRPTRGAIRADLPRWLGEDGLSSRIAAVRRAHPRHGGSGAAYLILKRKRG
ncbi:DNA mismatch repair protein MutS [Sandaracinobacter neustonicus]|uniref:DNA mismatch repair protein MutS n=1 Tax=Sandaracinobacter neustonicus TaxID=1715348 RepID=A0A501XTE6_9SPHN|nr:Smr/MutS family protein [Sandaracinobacter neustonicus]TPE63643.1 DNA mismatch repair protein MutS [Sandaracinobacter neustonicus]